MKILILGSNGFIGSNLSSFLKKKKIRHFTDLGRGKLNLLSLNNFKFLINKFEPEVVINCLGVVGGIQWGLNNKIKIVEENNLLNINLLKSIKGKNIILINLLANCIYPYKLNKFSENKILEGPIHSSVFEYGMSRRLLYTAVNAYSKEKLIDFINLIPANVYGPGDHFDPERSHALGALISKFYQAKKNNFKSVEIWGTGKPKRDWLYIEDLNKIIFKTILLRKKLINKTFNVASGNSISIKKLAKIIANQLNYKGIINYNKNYPDGDLVKSFDTKILNKYLNYKNFTDIDKGINKTIKFLKQNEYK